MRRAIIIPLVLLLATPAAAEWPEFNCRAWRADLYWRSWAREHCGKHHWRRHHRRRHHVRRQAVVVQNARCKPFVAATGDQGQDEGSAWDRAVTAWRGRVRWLYGERYVNEERAQNLSRDCGPSSVKDSVRDATLPQLYRCEITARPCRSEAQRVGRGD